MIAELSVSRVLGIRRSDKHDKWAIIKSRKATRGQRNLAKAVANAPHTLHATIVVTAIGCFIGNHCFNVLAYYITLH